MVEMVRKPNFYDDNLKIIGVYLITLLKFQGENKLKTASPPKAAPELQIYSPYCIPISPHLPPYERHADGFHNSC